MALNSITTVQYGTAIEFYTEDPFTALDGVTLVDPDTVTFTFSVEGDATSPHTYVYTRPSGDPSNTIVRDSVGVYHAIIRTILFPAGIWTYTWSCAPSNSVHLDPTSTEVVAKPKTILVQN